MGTTERTTPPEPAPPVAEPQQTPQLTVLSDRDLTAIGTVRFTSETLHWAGGTWLGCTIHREDHDQCHRERAEAIGWVQLQDHLFRPVVDALIVRVRDRAGEAPWGSGPTNPLVRRVVISALCPTCGQRRGEPRNLNQCDDGAYYSVDVWENPCGHRDPYTAVVAEAAARAAQEVS